MPEHIEMNPTSHLTIGTIGEPGNRTFYLQGGYSNDYISLTIEKMQANALADSFESLLEELGKKHPELFEKTYSDYTTDMRLVEPVTSLFRVGNLGLGYNEEEHKIVLVAYELVPEDEEDTASVVSYWASLQQILSLIDQARAMVRGGRPICGNCGNPMEPSGHFCAHRNGYKG